MNIPRCIKISTSLYPDHIVPRVCGYLGESSSREDILRLRSLYSLARIFMPMAFPFYMGDFGLHERDDDGWYSSYGGLFFLNDTPFNLMI